MSAGNGGPALPADLRERVLAGSLRARAAGYPDPVPAQISPGEAFARRMEAFDRMLRGLRDEDWKRPALRDLDVQGLVGHLTGVAEDVHRCLAGDPGVAAASHVESTQPAAARQAGHSPGQTRAEWRRAANRTLYLADAIGDLRAEVAVHGLRLPLGLLLVVLTFELWTHDNDIRQAIAMPPSVPDTSTLRLMTESAAGILPHAATTAGLSEPVNVHLVLTGAGGGTWDIPMGETPSSSAVIIVTDAVGFCRLVANRATPDMLDLHVTGDVDRATGVLAAASSLALD